MSKQKATVLITALLLVLCLLSSCGSKEKASDEPTKEPTYKHEEFIYDNKISWNASYSDIVNAYGKPDKVFHNDTSISIRYNYPTVGGYRFAYRMFYFGRNDGRLSQITLSSSWSDDFSKVTDDKIKMSENLKNVLVSKYGEPDKVYRDDDIERTTWESTYAETVINHNFTKTYGWLSIVYRNKHDYSNEKHYSDLPTPEPEPTATPVNATGL